MERHEVESKMKNIFAEKLGLDRDVIKDASSPFNDLGADSLDLVELLLATESEFNISIKDEDCEKMFWGEPNNSATVKSCIDFLWGLLNE